MFVILDYNTGNLNSIRNMLRKAGTDATISGDPEVIMKATKLLLPGVGHFDYGMRNLHQAGFMDVLQHKVLVEKTPILGICLGVQLFTKRSDEGTEPGLGWIDAETILFDRNRLPNNLKVPHMGWTDVTFRPESRLFKGMYDEPRFYFVHSYHLKCNDPADVLTECSYGYPFAAGIERDNIVGVQFHPEKSHKFGTVILRNFVENY